MPLSRSGIIGVRNPSPGNVAYRARTGFSAKGMSWLDKQNAISKIKKCLALAESLNKHEAASALRQAQALIRKHGVNELELISAEIARCDAIASAKSRPSEWESLLASTVAKVFGCRALFVTDGTAARWAFIGAYPTNELAQYGFVVMLEQLKAQRNEYRKKHCMHLIEANRVIRADLFCLGWVDAVRRNVQALARKLTNSPAINAYLETNFEVITDLVVTNRSAGKELTVREEEAMEIGAAAGRIANLTRALGCNTNTCSLLKSA